MEHADHETDVDAVLLDAPPSSGVLSDTARAIDDAGMFDVADDDGDDGDEAAMSPRPVLAFSAPPPAISGVLPQDFPLLTLLRFLPDVRLKQRADALAADALAIDVKAEGGLVAADAALAPLRDTLKEIEQCFKEPTDLANQLHKRLTGLRGDFMSAGDRAVKAVGAAIYAENQRQKQLVAEQKRLAQEQADKEARAAAAKAAREAEKRNASPEVVKQMKAAAKTVTAPPVAAPVAMPVLANTSVVENWKARLKATQADAEPHPKTADMNIAEQEQFKELLRAVLDGRAPLTAVEPGWSVLDARANSERTTMAIPGIEAFDAGSTRGKGRR